MFSEMHHIAIIASDYQQAKSFYVDKLGFKVIREHHRPEKQDIKIDLAFGSSEIELFVVAKPPKRPSYPEAAGLRHLAFRVTNIEQVVAELEAKGIPCEPIRLDSFTNKKMTFFQDPDGLPLELHE
jgi:glyoxylase I family protein